jgi:hypothetical protein
MTKAKAAIVDAWADEYREMGLAHVQCWFIPADQQ